MKDRHKTTLINANTFLNGNIGDFGIRALQLFHYQYDNNPLYHEYCRLLSRSPENVHNLTEIPFLPISFFKTHTVLTAPAMADACELEFRSSGTTGMETSRHLVWSANVYTESLLAGFREFYGDPADYAILALLPSYLERANASLVHMAKVLMEHSGHRDNGFYINEWDDLAQTILRLQASGQKVLLLGVTFALLDFAETHPMSLSDSIIVMETGGMKGRRAEMTRKEVHDILKSAWGLSYIHSEYGMTELLSQGYSAGEGIYRPSSTMQVLVRDINDPLEVMPYGSGVLNVVDLANIYSCAFIATEDIGKVYPNGSFEVLGRLDHSMLRGCSLMTA